jgi:hypothetical protein
VKRLRALEVKWDSTFSYRAHGIDRDVTFEAEIEQLHVVLKDGLSQHLLCGDEGFDDLRDRLTLLNKSISTETALI